VKDDRLHLVKNDLPGLKAKLAAILAELPPAP